LKAKQLKHKRIELELRQLAKTLPPEARLPAERDLAIKYECNFLTVRKALKQLTVDGLIVRRIGSGTFIASPGAAASNGVSRKGDRVGVLVYQRGNAYSFSLLQAIAHVALAESVELRSCWISDFSENGLRQAASLANEGCCTLTLPWFPPEMTDDLQNFVRRCPVPISLPALIPGLERNCFEQTHLYGATMLATTEGMCRYFTLLGHRRIAFLGPNSPADPVLQRQLGAYTCFMSRESLPTVSGLVESSPRAMDQLAAQWKAYRGDLAIVSYDDEHALRFLTSMHKIGLSAPGDFAIVGYNNVDGSHYSDPPLSTVRQNFDYIAHWLVKSALGLAKGEVCQAHRGPPLDLLIRATCGGRLLIDDAMREALRGVKVEVYVEPEAAGHGAASKVEPAERSLTPARS
jgi:DNA-binding LacI/PurR family transcriptional regulator